MICPKCNTNNDADAVFCTKCGTNLRNIAPSSSSSSVSPQSSLQTLRNNRSDILTLIAILDIVIGALGFISGVLIWTFYPHFLNGSYYNGYFGYTGMMDGYTGLMGNYMGTMMSLVATGFILIGLPMIIAGLGLYSMKKWAQLLHTIVWIPILLMIPIGTIIGIIVIWSVYTQETSKMFQTTPN